MKNPNAVLHAGYIDEQNNELSSFGSRIEDRNQFNLVIRPGDSRIDEMIPHITN